MKLQIIVILLATVGIVTGIAQLGDGQIFITVTSEGKAKISQSIFPETFVSSIDVKIISENISNLLAIDEENILLGTTQNDELLKIATLGASAVDLKYNADILSYESGIFKLKYNSDLESRVNLPPLSKLVSLNTIPIEITDEEYVLPPGDISLSFSIRPVTSKEFFVPIDDTEYKIEAITAAKIEQFSANADEIQFIIKDKAIVLTIIPTKIMSNPNDALLNGEKVDFSQFHKNSTHSWIRIDPHEKGLVKILDTTEKTEEGGGCLIATATYGSEMAPQVQFLREIRDNQLMKSDSGSSFMTGFNQLYYFFSPTVADWERENPIFKEFVKIAITPLLSSLSIMEYAESEHEILGFGIGIILINIGMYLVLPVLIFYKIGTNLRTAGTNKSNWMVISRYTVLSSVKNTLFGIIVLLGLTVSVSSAFVESAYADEAGAIQVILGITYENIQESFADAELNPEDDPVFLAAQEDYFEALAALEAGDLAAAEENALSAMNLFEISAENIGELLEVQQATIQPLGLSTATSIFNIQERITDTDDETNELRELVKLNNFDDVDFSEYDESVNLAKTLLADGFVPDAQAQLELANSIKDNLYEEIATIAGEQAAENIKETLGEQENLGLTNKAINDLEDILEDLTTEETGEGETSVDDGVGNSGDEAPGNSANAPGQNKADSEDDAPGNSANAPGQNQDSSGEDADLPPGFESATENGNGLGIGKIPPGLAKLFENGDADLPPGFESATENGNGLGIGNIPPGQLKKFDSYEASFEQSPDDFYENSFEASIDGVFETNFDGTNKGNGDGKGKFGAFPGKSGIDPRLLEKPGNNGNPPGKAVGLPFCAGKATGGIPIILLTGGTVTIATAGTPYVEPGYRACSPGINEITSNVVVSNGTGTLIVSNPSDGAYVINYDVTDPSPPGFSATTVTRTVLVGPNTAPTVIGAGVTDQSVSGPNVPDFVIDLATVFDDTEEGGSGLTYSITDNQFTGLFQSIGITGTTLTIDYLNGPTGDGTGIIEITATDSWGESVVDTFTVTDS
jgi:hypothetical protein